MREKERMCRCRCKVQGCYQHVLTTTCSSLYPVSFGRQRGSRCLVLTLIPAFRCTVASIRHVSPHHAVESLAALKRFDHPHALPRRPTQTVRDVSRRALHCARPRQSVISCAASPLAFVPGWPVGSETVAPLRHFARAARATSRRVGAARLDVVSVVFVDLCVPAVLAQRHRVFSHLLVDEDEASFAEADPRCALLGRLILCGRIGGGHAQIVPGRMEGDCLGLSQCKMGVWPAEQGKASKQSLRSREGER